MLPIEAESQDTALRIFSTLNDRGLPLSDADIFKTQFYKFFKDKDSKDQFIKRWKELEKRCMGVFQKHSVPMDELFTRYMYYERARQGIKGSTTAGLRKFYEKDKYRLLKSEETLKNLELLADFWHDVSMQDKERFSDERILKYFFVLNDAPNAMWTFFVSVYFLHNKDDDGHLETEKFVRFLTKTIAFVWTQAILGRGIGALRTPMFAEMVNIVQGKQVEFSNDKFEREQTESALRTGDFPNRRPITRAMLSWWAFADPSQELLPTGTMFETEHIVSKKRQDAEDLLNNSNNLESLGNKILLEEGINIRASDYRFSDKKKYYQGFTDGKGKNHQGSKVAELLQLCDQTDFIEADIEERKEKIIDWFMRFLEDNGLLKN